MFFLTEKSLLCLSFILFLYRPTIAQNIFPANDNVGIGTTIPEVRLHIKKNALLGDNSSTSNTIDDLVLLQVPYSSLTPSTYNGTGYKWGLRFFGTNESGYKFHKSAGIYAVSEDGSYGFNRAVGLAFHTASLDSQDKERFRISSNGNVGIGISDPQYRLHVNGTFTASSITVQNSDTWQSGLNIYNNLNNGFQFNVGGTTNQVLGTGNLGIYGSEANKYLLAISPNGNVGIGTTSPSQKLAVNGTIRGKEVIVEGGIWPDYVFENSYELLSLNKLAEYIAHNKHLPGIPSVKEIEKTGVSLGQTNAKLLEKIEELTLYIIDQNRRLDKQQQEINTLQKQVELVVGK
jgi:hypothetical protein